MIGDLQQAKAKKETHLLRREEDLHHSATPRTKKEDSGEEEADQEEYPHWRSICIVSIK
jgi:hypothetical protein